MWSAAWRQLDASERQSYEVQSRQQEADGVTLNDSQRSRDVRHHIAVIANEVCFSVT